MNERRVRKSLPNNIKEMLVRSHSIFHIQLLYLEWANLKKWYKKQPLWLIKNYFGVKIGLYFAWLGFYTQMLVIPAFVGLFCFIYGCVTISSSSNQQRQTILSYLFIKYGSYNYNQRRQSYNEPQASIVKTQMLNKVLY